MTNICDKTNCVLHIKKKKKLKQALKYGLLLKNVHRVINFNKDEWLKPYIEMNTDYEK